MKKGNKVIKNVIIVLAIIILSIVAFVGIYVKENGVYVNKIPNFTYGMEIDGTRELRYLLDTTSEEKEVYVDENGNIMGIVPTSEEETTDEVSLDTTVENKEEKESSNVPYKTEKRVIKANPDEKTLEHFENTKKVIQDRLSKKKEIEYNIRLDTLSNNELVLEVPNNEKIVTYARNAVESIGKFEIVDNETGIVLMDNSHVDGAVAAIGGAMDAQGNSIPGKSQVYLTITLTKEGKAKFNELSKKYPVTKDEAGNETSKLISMTIDGMKILETAFEQEYDNKLIQLPMGNPSDSAEDINQIYNEVNYLAMSVDSGRMPLVYKLATDNFIQSHITKDIIYLSIAIFAAFVLIVTIIFVVKFKAKGLMAGILNVGYIALVVIAARYADIVITLNSCLAVVAVTLINLAFMYMFLKTLKEGMTHKEAFIQTFKNVYLAIVPICIIAIIFTCLGNAVVGSIGTVLFWGILIHMIYSYIVVKTAYGK